MNNYLYIETVGKKIVEQLVIELDRVGILYRIFYRVKSDDSIRKKIERKRYDKTGNKLTDLLGIRLTLYFKDDVRILYKYLKTKKNFNHEALDTPSINTFEPERLNLVFNFCEKDRPEILTTLGHLGEIIDTTYEIQIRTVLSEGWHEVEHDLRYKSQEDWIGHADLLRNLNGLFATLDTSDFTMLKIFDTLSYRHYKKKNCSALIKSKFRLRFISTSPSQAILDVIDGTPGLLKKLYQVDREALLENLLSSKVAIPLTIDNFTAILNHIFIKEEKLFKIADDFINDEIESGLVSLKQE